MNLYFSSTVLRMLKSSLVIVIVIVLCVKKEKKSLPDDLPFMLSNVPTTLSPLLHRFIRDDLLESWPKPTS